MSLPTLPAVKDKIARNGHIKGKEPLNGIAYACDFSIPVIATAIHAGSHVRKEIQPFMEIPPARRRFEEDTATEKMIEGLPNTVWGLDSRAVYDLNRPPDQALPLTPERFWDVKVYHAPPTEAMNRESLRRHARFYDFMGTLVSHMLERFNICIVLDIHSYNISRQQKKGFATPPVFNLGTQQLNRMRWQPQITAWLGALQTIELPGITTTVAENKVFYGNGQLCKLLSLWDPRILVLSTEIAKVYMDEHTGVVFEPVVEALQQAFARIISHLPS